MKKQILSAVAGALSSGAKDIFEMPNLFKSRGYPIPVYKNANTATQKRQAVKRANIRKRPSCK